MLILRDDELINAPSDGIDDPYFKLIHRMKQVERLPLPEGFEIIQCNTEDLADHIRECYDKINISAEILRRNEMAPGYDPGLQIAVSERNRKKIIASGIAEYDPQVREGILDWIQVSPAYRRRNLGRFIVCELLHRLQKKADFVTVSGRVNNPDHPLELYESCGFTDLTIWHIITRIDTHRI
ncbi:MAG: GNAT family N-acetyltransferase [Flexilinea sp.]|nr:GNAT family N-acetyltransferase [Flexilinea sp.]